MMRKYIYLGLVFSAVSVSIVVAAIVSAKHHHTHDNSEANDESSKNPLSGRSTSPDAFNTYSDRLNHGWDRTQYSSVVIFGASDCDNAHPRPAIYADTIRGPPYYQGRFTNGLVFGEYMAASVLTGKNISLLNYAYGDATVNNALVKVNAPDTRAQMEMYIKDLANGAVKRGNDKDGRVLHCVWIGINDIIQIWTDVITNGTFQNGNANGPQTGFESGVNRVKVEAKELIDQIRTLRSNSHVNSIKSDFLLMLLAPLEIVPNLYYQSRDLAKKDESLTKTYLKYIGNLTSLYNHHLAEGINNLLQESDYKPKSPDQPLSFSHRNVKYMDIPAYWYFVKNNPEKYNFVNVLDACWNSTTGANCKEPTRWEYYDTLHPTTTMHKYIAEEITVQVNL